MDLQSILNKTKSFYISVSDKEGNVIDAVEKDAFGLKKEISLGGAFFFKSGSDFFTKVLKENELEQISLTSNDTSVLLVKNSTQELLFSIYSKNELNLSIIKILIEKYGRSN